MAANTAPLYPLTPNAGVAGNLFYSTVLTNTKAYDGTDTVTAIPSPLLLLYTAGVNGSRVDSITVRYTSTVGATVSGTTTASLLRLWINNGTANTTASNNTLLAELAIPAQAMVALNTSVVLPLTIPAGFVLPAGYKIYGGITVAIGGTNAALTVSILGGDY